MYGTFISLAGLSKKMSEKKLAKLENDAVASFWITYLKNLALHSLTFEGLPDTVSERVLQESLLYYGAAVFFDVSGALLQLPGKPAYDPTMYGDYRFSYVYGRNGFNALVRLKIPGGYNATILTDGIQGLESGAGAKFEGYLVRDQYDMSTPLIWAVMIYAKRIADAYRSMDVAVRNGKFPGIWLVPKTQQASVEAFARSMDNNETNVITSTYFPIDRIKYQPISQDGLKASQNFMQIIGFYIDSFLQLLGLEGTTATDFKKANITADELKIGGNIAGLSVRTRIETIQEGLNFINSERGTHITVRQSTEEERKEGGEKDGDNLRDVQGDR